MKYGKVSCTLFGLEFLEKLQQMKVLRITGRSIGVDSLGNPANQIKFSSVQLVGGDEIFTIDNKFVGRISNNDTSNFILQSQLQIHRIWIALLIEPHLE